MTGARRSRVRTLASLAGLSALVTGCGAGGDNPFASFESRCAKLPPAQLKVVQAPLAYGEDASLPAQALAERGGSAMPGHRTLGLTTARFGYQSEYEVRALEDRRGERACGHAFVRITLSATPMTVFLARELSTNPCKRAVTLEHEQKHVDVYREVLAEATPELEQVLRKRVGTALRRGTSGVELQRQLDTTMRELLADFMREQSRVLNERQAEVDSPAEYARLSGACRS